MVPASIRSNLSSLRRRERLLTFVWGLACWLAIALLLLLTCAFVDWLIDRDIDTPMWLRAGLLYFQIGVWAIAGFRFILWPQIRWLPDEKLALWVESKIERFDQRLISAVQLNKPRANIGGMSTELIAVMTREVETEARGVGFAQIADHRRLLWSVALTVPLLLLVALPFVLFPQLSFALLARQTLAEIEIPRSVKLVNESVKVWPIGDTVPIRFRVSGDFDEDMIGSIHVSPGGRFDLEFIEQDKKGALFGANIDATKLPTTERLTFRARLADGRTRKPAEMQLVPRPVVTDNQAWVILPAFCDTRPVAVKKRYERPQARGDVVGIPGSAVRVRFETQRPIKKAWLELRGRAKFDPTKSAEETAFHEISKGKLVMTITPGHRDDAKSNTKFDIWSAATTFDLADDLTGYVMIVEDEHGFENIPKPRRALRVVPEEPPQVALLPISFGSGAAFDLEGMPVPLGGAIPIPYQCSHAYGLGKAQLLYRVLKKHESGVEPPEEEKWQTLSLKEAFRPRGDDPVSDVLRGSLVDIADRLLGPFDPKTGAFADMSVRMQVPFHAVPSADPDRVLGRTTGGGRFYLQTNGLIDSKGPVKLKSGDQIEYCVEVFGPSRLPPLVKALTGEAIGYWIEAIGADRVAAWAIPSARSESRVSTIMDEKEFTTWMRLVGQEDERVRQLEKLQRSIFEPK